MSPRKRRMSQEEVPADVTTSQGPVLPKGSIGRLNIGQSFAEYDPALEDAWTYVQTPAYSAALDFHSGKYFFVGRRGTGKTALRRFCAAHCKKTVEIVPEILSPNSLLVGLDLFANSSKKPFRSLVSAFRRALQLEALVLWRREHPTYVDLPPNIEAELSEFGDLDFDSRALQFIARISRPLARGDEQAWLAESKAVRRVADEMKELVSNAGLQYTILFDSIDDYWEGTEESLVYLTAFMHACLEMSAQTPWARALLFLRENIFERVRARDSESSRIETAVVGLEWTPPQLLELVERRLNRPFNTKYALGGATWNVWFENPDEARDQVFTYCQRRPRDVLIYVSNALESAQANKHERLLIEDLQGARRRFSDNRFKDLGDKYAENFPQLAIVLSRFYGLGQRFTLGGLEAMARKLQQDREVSKLCGSWIFDQSASIEIFVRLLYNIGFLGISAPGGTPRFRSLGPQDTTPPPVSDSVDLVIHRCYWDALDLQDALVRTMSDDGEFGRVGLLEDLPGGLDAEKYADELDLLAEELETLPVGSATANQFEDLVGSVIRLCFYRSLDNVEARSRDVESRIIRDWVTANRAQSGFWEAVRVRYDATQVVWECKNYADLKSDDFHQASYYLNAASGRFLIVAFRGSEVSKAALGHIKRIAADKGGMVLPLTQRDLMTFIRQAKNGKVKEDHIQDRYDHIVRQIS